MKFITFKYDNREQVGILTRNEQGIYPIKTLGVNYETMNDLIEHMTDQETKVLQSCIERDNDDAISINNVCKMSPIPSPKQDIICLGINYMAHAVESARYKKEDFGGDRSYAVYFSKRANMATGYGDYIPSYPELVDSLDYEAELAVIIKKDAKNVTKENAYDYVFGYTIMNDVSARNLQTRHKQWYFGKSLDGFTPIGPWIVTKDEFTNPPVLKICSRVNGELRQDSSTDLMITSIEDVIHELSQGVTLRAGTIIAMGTPSGVGMGFEPPKFLKSGDVVECEIEGIGCLQNTVK